MFLRDVNDKLMLQVGEDKKKAIIKKCRTLCLIVPLPVS
jgi:hypothetical protein